MKSNFINVLAFKHGHVVAFVIKIARLWYLIQELSSSDRFWCTLLGKPVKFFSGSTDKDNWITEFPVCGPVVISKFCTIILVNGVY